MTVFIHFGISEEFEAVSQNNDAGIFGNLEVQVDVPMTENVIIVVGFTLFLLRKKDQFFLVFAFVGTRIGKFLEAALFRPTIAEFVTQFRRQAALKELRNRIMEEPAQTDE